MISNPLSWPNGNRCAVAITWDVDADSGLNFRYPRSGDNLVATQSLLRYGPIIGVPRLVEIFKRLEIKQTFFVPGWVMEQYPSAIELILKNGHELALHGYMHERSNELTKDEETEVLERSLEAFVRIAGTRPKGWRAPGFAFSKNSAELLMRSGFKYDSSLMGDEIPYVLRDSAGQIMEFATDWTFDDWPHYMHNRDFAYPMPISAPSRAMEVFRAEFDAAWEYGALWITVWHPFLSGRLSRLHAIVELYEYMREKGSVWFPRLDEVFEHATSAMLSGKWTPRIEDIPPYDRPQLKALHAMKGRAENA